MALDRLATTLPKLSVLRTIELCIPIDRCLVRDKRIPRQAIEKIDQILTLDLVQSSPFGISDVVHDWFPLPSRDQLSPVSVRHIVLKRATLQPLLDDLKSRGIAVTAVRVADGAGVELPVDLLKRSGAIRKPVRWLHRAIAATAMISAATVAATATVEIWRYEIAAQEIALENEALKKQATAVRKQLSDATTASDQLTRLRLAKIDATPVVQVWDDVTRLLPGTTWLTQLAIDNDVVTLDGLSKSASELIGILSASPSFKNVEFASPVTRDSSQAAERFQIRLRAGRWSEKKKASKASQAVP